LALEVPELSGNNPQLQRSLEKIVRLQEKPIQKVDEKIAKVDNKLKLYKDLATKVNEMKDSIAPFRTVQEFRDLSATSSDPKIMSPGAIDKTKAVPGSYKFEVQQLANPASLMTSGVADRDKTELGVGYISFETPDGGSQDVYINSSNNTLDGIASAINSSGSGVRAQVVNDGTDSEEPWRLILSGEKSGWKNDYEWAQFNFLDGDIDLDHERKSDAKSAIIKFNGQPLYVDENTVNDLIPGVTINLNKAAPGDMVTLEVKPDFEKIGAKAQNFVAKMNEVLTFINYQSQLDASSRNDPSKALAGDSTLQSIKSRITRLVQDTSGSLEEAQVAHLRDMGVVFNKTGTLDFDQKKFESAVATRFDEVANLLSGSGPLSGFANEMVKVAEQFTRSQDGFVTLRQKGMESQKQRLEKEKEDKTKMAEAKVQRAREQFGKAEAAIANMQSMRAQIAQGGGV
jgi:flagellar hook-associated protein 2